MLCLGTAGDWTKGLYEKIQAPVSKPMNIIGPFLSSFSDRAIKTRNAIAVASGIGITPTLSLMQSYVGTKRINIVWVCRDPGLVEYFLHKVDLASITKFAFAMIFYTGKRELVLPKNVPANFFIFRTRPELERIVAGIVSTIESGEDLPEEMYRDQAELVGKTMVPQLSKCILPCIPCTSNNVIHSFFAAVLCIFDLHAHIF